MKFKIGDIVTCIDNREKETTLTINKDYKIYDILSNSLFTYITVKNDKDTLVDYFEWRFEYDIKKRRKDKLKQLNEKGI